MENLNSLSPSFCVFPFVHFLAGPTEHWRLCCVAQEGIVNNKGEPYLLQDHNPKALWNSEGMRKIRRQMWEGKKLSQCRHCYYQESVNRKSYRQRSNEEWLKRSKVKKIISESVKSNFYVQNDPLYIDLRPGNLCNLRCRMCNPGNSSKIEMEWRQLRDNKSFQEAIGARSFMFKSQRKGIPWERKEDFWESLGDWMGGLTKLYLTGGEPTLIKNNWKLIDRLIESGRSQSVTLIFNINCTRIPKSLINTFQHFKSVCLNLSLDAKGAANDYIRDPSRWDEVESNVKQLLTAAKGRNVVFRVTPVAQVYNILNLTELFLWVDGLEKEFFRKIVIELLILDNDPPCLDIRILPEAVRQSALEKMQNYLKNSERAKWDEAFENCMGSVMHILGNVTHKESSRLLNQFKNYTLILDKHRKSDFQDALPDLSRFIPLNYTDPV